MLFPTGIEKLILGSYDAIGDDEMNTNDNDKSNRLNWWKFLLIVLILLLLINAYELYLLLTSKNSEFKFEFKVIDAIIGAATVFIACYAYQIQRIQLEIQKGQAIVQLNQAFNDINKTILSSKSGSIKNFAKAIYSSNSELANKDKVLNKYLSDRVEITSLIFMVLNAYEAYYINNKEAFKGNIPLVLKNLFIYSEEAENILKAHSDNKEFKKSCQEFLRDTKGSTSR